MFEIVWSGELFKILLIKMINFLLPLIKYFIININLGAAPQLKKKKKIINIKNK